MSTKQLTAEVSLFPFLDVLSGVVGILILIITALAAMGMSNVKTLIEFPLKKKDSVPIFVECRKEGLVIHPDQLEIAADTVERSSEWQTFIKRCARRSQSTHVVLLVRNDGIGVFQTAKLMLEQEGCRYGFDVLLGGGELKVQYKD